MNSKQTNIIEELFKEHFKPLCHFSMKFTYGNLDDAKELVHKVFIKVWEKIDSFPKGMNFKSYLYTAVNNYGLNFIRDNKKFVPLDPASTEHQIAPETGLETQELKRSIEYALNMLPEKCRQVFEYSRYEGLKYAAIADKMGISVKTVEAQMTKALKILREHLSEFLAILFFMFFWQMM